MSDPPPQILDSSFLWQDVQYPKQHKSKPRIMKIRIDWKCQILKKGEKETQLWEIRRVIALPKLINLLLIFFKQNKTKNEQINKQQHCFLQLDVKLQH